ncbi:MULTISPECIES: hypothetical protein [unclassified Salinibacterium]|uniref:hypothetical protein n=1 Tax=unclassified Salinibacterium TaxID=2632331 RepID=UPI00142007E8|nr:MULTISPECIES: hypothetical protein [unclassified Salinibacterium]
MTDSPNLSDSPRVTEQAALTTSSGLIWLVIAGILSVVSIGFLWPMTQLTRMCPLMEPAAAYCSDGTVPTVPLVGIALIVLIYAAMVVIRYTVERLRFRLALMAILTALIPIVFLICGSLVILSQEGPIDPMPLG